MTDPIKKLKKDMQPVLNGCSFEHRHEVLAVLDAFAAEWEAKEGRAWEVKTLCGPKQYWASLPVPDWYPGSAKPQTILVPRKTVSLMEAAEALVNAVGEFPMFSGSGALKAAEDDLRVKRDAVRAALAKEKR